MNYGGIVTAGMIWNAHETPERPLDPPEYVPEIDEDALYEEQRQQRIDDLDGVLRDIAGGVK